LRSTCSSICSSCHLEPLIHPAEPDHEHLIIGEKSP
jgi:hypothetical protein